MRHSAPSRQLGRVATSAERLAAEWNRIGRQTQFYAKTLGSVGDALINYKVELIRLIAQMALGTGALMLIGGTVAIVGFLTLAAGALTAQQGYHELSNVGVEALMGFIAAYVDVRLAAPLISAVGLAATIGAGATAQLGAMRINEEIDALEVMGVRSVAYLASTRLIAGLVVVIPLYCIAVLTSSEAARLIVAMYGQSSGVYDHYFNTFLNPTDVLWSLLLTAFSAVVVMLVHTYYGYTATGGPAGVGEAVGRAVRTSLVVAVFVMLFASLAIYGHHGNFHLSG